MVPFFLALKLLGAAWLGTTIPANLRGGLPTRVKDYTRLGLKAILFSETTLLIFQS